MESCAAARRRGRRREELQPLHLVAPARAAGRTENLKERGEKVSQKERKNDRKNQF